MTTENSVPSGPYGLLAEFADAGELVRAARAARDQGYEKIEGYTPFPVEELSEALGQKPSKLPALVFLGGLTGILAGLGLMVWAEVISYPKIIGGKPFFSWPMFVPIMFECTVLGASLTAVVAMLALNGYPQPYHPLFNVERFARVTRDGFFLCVEADDPKFRTHETADFLRGLGAREVTEVPQ
jgi:hypothetical protein